MYIPDTGSEQLFAEIEKLGSSENEKQEVSHLKSIIHERCEIPLQEIDHVCELAAARATAKSYKKRLN